MNQELENNALQDESLPAPDAVASENPTAKPIKKRFTVLRIIAFLLAFLVPLPIIGISLILILGDAVLNTAFWITYILIPLGTVTLLAVSIFSNIKGWIKLLVVSATLVLCVCLFLKFSTWGKFALLSEYEDQKLVEEYELVQQEFKPLPDLSELGTTTQLEFYDYFSQQAIFFDVEVKVLICHYDTAEYQTQKAKLEETYLFQSKEFPGGDRKTTPPTAEIDGYYFRVLDTENESYELYEVKRMILIATNDQTQEIVYMTFDDDDLDYISSMTDFINDDCGWKYMR